ncbi:hypothetical protein VUR80DRAFT_2829 [Thermomyces stellatus]
MPRIPPSALRATTPNLARLLPAVRDLNSARNELRWLREHVAATGLAGRCSSARRLAGLCGRRGKGVPLQYILGTQPFGDLEIRCERGVLIPRVETEAYTVHLAELLKAGRLVDNGREALRIVDFCTGTGCIPLLLASLLARAFPALHVHGVDISPRALSLSHQNFHSALSKSQIPPPSPTRSVTFHHGDLLSARWRRENLPGTIPKCDVLVSNPPYVSAQTWRLGRGELSYSTRKFEPKLALVPRHVDPPWGCRQEDVFYAALLDAANLLEPSVALFEFGDAAQGMRILEFALGHPFCRDAEFEFWRDYPDVEGSNDDLDTPAEVHVRDRTGLERVVPIRGCGIVRSILIRKQAARIS